MFHCTATKTAEAAMAKMTATVQVEFELLEGQENTANKALIGGVGALKLAIERGVTGTG